MGRAVSGLEAYCQWQERLKSFESSRLSVDAFCQQEGVPRATFVDWLLILKRKPVRPEAVDQEAGDESAEGPAFVPVSVKASSYEIELPNGSLVRLPVSTDQAVLMEVIGAVAELEKEPA